MSVYSGPADWWADGTNDGRTHIATKGIVQNGLVLNLDAGVNASYPGSGTTWTDLSGSSNHATLFGGAGYSTSNGGILTFDGTDDGASAPDSASLNFTTGLTLSSWFKFNALPTAEIGLFRKQVQWQLGLTNATTIRCLVYTNGTSGWTVANDVAYSFTLGAWYNMIMTYDGSGMLIYVNNQVVKVGVATGTIVATANALQIGYHFSYLNGAMGNCQIYNRALSAAEIQQNFNALRSRFGV